MIPRYRFLNEILPPGAKELSIVTLTLPNLTDTDALRSSFYSMLEFLKADSASYRRLRIARERTNKILKGWLRQSSRREKNKKLKKAVQTVLDLSADTLP